MNRSLSLLVTAALVFSCSSPETYKEDADREVGEILKDKQETVFGSFDEISIEWSPDYQPAAVDRPTGDGAPPVSGKMRKDVLKAWDGPLVTLSLADALNLAVRNSREYQSEKENVYLSALSLSLERHRWDFIFSGEMDGAYTRQDFEYASKGGFSTGVNKALAAGGQIGLNVGANFFRYFTGDPQQSFISTVSLAFSQPLLRGAGRAVALETLTQAERDTVYSLREYRRYRQTFAVSIATEYFRVLQQKDQVNNEFSNYNSLRIARERTKAFADSGRLPKFEVDQAQQDELRARDRWIRAIQASDRVMDNFKMTLGLRTDANIDLDVNELGRLSGGELSKIELEEIDAVRVAFMKRMDFLNSLDEVDDAVRKIDVAQNGFLPELNIVGGADFGSKGPHNVINFRPRAGVYELGLELDLPFDRKEERNLFRQALITFERTKRDLQREADSIRLEIRNTRRSLEQARESYEIQSRSVRLAETRVESTNMLIKYDKASTRDLLESQSAHLEAKNALTRVLVDFYIAQLELWSAMGVLAIDDSGNYHEPSEEDLFRLISRSDSLMDEDNEQQRENEK